MNILIFGPNGSGKGAQGAIIQKKFSIPHIETGMIFRDNISRETDLGKIAKEYVNNGNLVPDTITIPMILNRLKENGCKNGWFLDGFPRNLIQAEALYEALQKKNITIDYIIEIILDRDTAKKRIMGRRLCVNDNNHPNNVNIDAIKPSENNGKLVCRVCGGNLSTRVDDQEVEAIDKRHDIYYDDSTGTTAGINFFKKRIGVILVDGKPGVEEVAEELLQKLA